MIVVQRTKNESLVINDEIILTVIEVRGDKVRLGIEHPQDVTVHRQEVTRRSSRRPAPSPRLGHEVDAPRCDARRFNTPPA
jgi:carbon storage regulator